MAPLTAPGRVPRWLLAAAVILMTASSSTSARAGNAAAAEKLFTEAKALADGEDWAAACPKFSASQKLDPQLGTLLNLANCYEREGKSASAWARWREGLEWAQRKDDDRLKYIEDRIAAVTPTLAQVRFAIAGSNDLDVTSNGERVLPPTFGTPLPVDPGAVEVKVLRGDVVLETSSHVAKPGEVTVVTIDLEAIAKAHPAPLKVVPKPLPVPVRPQPVYVEPSNQATIGWVVASVGFAGLVAGGGFGLAALVADGEANQPYGCQNEFCTPQGLADANRARDFSIGALVAGGAGLAISAVGMTIVLTAPASGGTPLDNRATVQLQPWAAPGAAGMGLSGTW